MLCHISVTQYNNIVYEYSCWRTTTRVCIIYGLNPEMQMSLSSHGYIRNAISEHGKPVKYTRPSKWILDSKCVGVCVTVNKYALTCT